MSNLDGISSIMYNNRPPPPVVKSSVSNGASGESYQP